MKLVTFKFNTLQENLACDEALLDLCDQDREEESLRFWEPTDYAVVVGYANKVSTEVDMDFCRHQGIPILRRCSGGGTVLQGPGCLNYSLVLRIGETGPLSGIHSTNCHIMSRHRKLLEGLLGLPVELCGDTDLAIKGLKISGNAQRRKRQSLLFHGCFLLNLDIALLEKALQLPSRQPAYRQQRSHSDFVRNLGISAEALKAAIAREWGATASTSTLPPKGISELVHEKYGNPQWNLKF